MPSRPKDVRRFTGTTRVVSSVDVSRPSSVRNVTREGGSTKGTSWASGVNLPGSPHTRGRLRSQEPLTSPIKSQDPVGFDCRSTGVGLPGLPLPRHITRVLQVVPGAVPSTDTSRARCPTPPTYPRGRTTGERGEPTVLGKGLLLRHGSSRLVEQVTGYRSTPTRGTDEGPYVRNPVLLGPRTSSGATGT